MTRLTRTHFMNMPAGNMHNSNYYEELHIFQYNISPQSDIYTLLSQKQICNDLHTYHSSSLNILMYDSLHAHCCMAKWQTKQNTVTNTSTWSRLEKTKAHHLRKYCSNSLGISFPLEQVFYSAISNPPVQNFFYWIFLFPFFSFCPWCCILVLSLATHTARTFH